jgi:hypothetical protein
MVSFALRQWGAFGHNLFKQSVMYSILFLLNKPTTCVSVWLMPSPALIFHGPIPSRPALFLPKYLAVGSCDPRHGRQNTGGNILDNWLSGLRSSCNLRLHRVRKNNRLGNNFRNIFQCPYWSITVKVSGALASAALGC